MAWESGLGDSGFHPSFCLWPAHNCQGSTHTLRSVHDSRPHMHVQLQVTVLTQQHAVYMNDMCMSHPLMDASTSVSVPTAEAVVCYRLKNSTTTLCYHLQMLRVFQGSLQTQASSTSFTCGPQLWCPHTPSHWGKTSIKQWSAPDGCLEQCTDWTIRLQKYVARA